MDLCESIAHQTTFSVQLAVIVGSSLTSSSNFVFSPISIHAALALLAAGSKDETLKQILTVACSSSAADIEAFYSQVASVVFADGSPSGGPMLAFANGVWIDKSLSLKTTFEEVISSAYKAEIRSLDFQASPVDARREVNLWVEDITKGLIKDLLQDGSVDHMTRLILCNALYFKGVWIESFDASQTEDSEFYLLDGSTAQVPFMTCENQQYLSSHNDFKVLKLLYSQGRDNNRHFSMSIFLPAARDGISVLTEKLSSESDFLNRHIPTQKIELGRFKVPKFKISFGFEATDLLQIMGLVLPFSANANLTEMVDSSDAGNLFVSSIHHKSFVEVNEEGTEAAAATDVALKLISLRSDEPMDFVADHPFLFMIREDVSGVVLFIGRVMNPLIES